MNCPRDGIELTSQEIEGITARMCGRCGGMFLGRGELNRIAGEKEGDVEYSTVSLDSFQHPDAFGPATCPQDGTTMRKVEFNIYTNIILDYCPACSGFWLDAHEIDRIRDEVRAMDEAAEDMPDPPMLWLARFVWALPK